MIVTGFPLRRSAPEPSGGGLLLAAVLATASPVARADCKLELELIGRDLRNTHLSEATKLQFAPVLDDAIKRCRIGREAAAMAFFARARKIAGIETAPDDLDAPPPNR